MRARMLVLGVCFVLAAVPAGAHGPQIQITADDGKLVTRRLFQEGPYGNALTGAKSVYVMPLAALDNVWYARPNNARHPDFPSLPAYFSGPGFAYGYDQSDGGSRDFEQGSVLSLGFTDGLKLWNGTTFVDAGPTELKAFRGTDIAIASPAENYAVTSDSGFDSLSLSAIMANYDADAHSTIRFGLLGDGVEPESPSPDGVYLVGLQASSTQADLEPSDPYYFVLHKNAVPADVTTAVDSLGFDAAMVQFVPEPGAGILLLAALAGLGGAPFAMRCRRGRR